MKSTRWSRRVPWSATACRRFHSLFLQRHPRLPLTPPFSQAPISGPSAARVPCFGKTSLVTEKESDARPSHSKRASWEPASRPLECDGLPSLSFSLPPKTPASAAHATLLAGPYFRPVGRQGPLLRQDVSRHKERKRCQAIALQEGLLGTAVTGAASLGVRRLAVAFILSSSKDTRVYRSRHPSRRPLFPARRPPGPLASARRLSSQRKKAMPGHRTPRGACRRKEGEEKSRLLRRKPDGRLGGERGPPGFRGNCLRPGNTRSRSRTPMMNRSDGLRPD